MPTIARRRAETVGQLWAFLEGGREHCVWRSNIRHSLVLSRACRALWTIMLPTWRSMNHSCLRQCLMVTLTHLMSKQLTAKPRLIEPILLPQDSRFICRLAVLMGSCPIIKYWTLC